MKTYIVSLKPLAPYFFGGERNFSYGTSGQQAEANPYYIVSEKIPSQSTLFGLTRYLGIVDKNEEFRIDKDMIGEATFAMEKEDQTFGKILGISGLFLERKKGESGEYLMPVPLDHVVPDKGSIQTVYRPMTYEKTVATTEGPMLLPKEYNAKNGFSDAYMNVMTGELTEQGSIFVDDVQTKISKSKEKEAFFKKKYRILQRGYAFAYEMYVEDDFPEVTDRIVYMGKEKSPFAVTVTEGTIAIKEGLFQSGPDYEKRVALSDCYLPEEELYDCCYMTYLEERTHREFYTRYGESGKGGHRARFDKKEYLYHLVKQGSVFIVKKDKTEAFDHIVDQAHRKTAGYNRMNGGK